MRLFAFTLVLYTFGVLDLHVWCHVPQTVAHWLEHHADFASNETHTDEHAHEHGDHEPFAEEGHGSCTAYLFLGNLQEDSGAHAHDSSARRIGRAQWSFVPLSTYSGSKWNPPKLV